MNLDYHYFEQLALQYIPTVVASLAVLILGWFLAMIISSLLRKVLKRLKFDDRVNQVLKTGSSPFEVTRWVGAGVFLLLMLVVFAAFFQVLGLSGISTPISEFLAQIFAYAPRLIAPVVLLFVAWILASSLRFLTLKLSKSLNLERKFSDLSEGPESQSPVGLERSFGEIVYWLVFLLFLPAVLDALALQGLLEPVQGMITKSVGFLPNVFAGVLVVALGWVGAKFAQKVTARTTEALGLNSLAEKTGLPRFLGDIKISQIVGVTVYILILVPAIIAGLDAMKLGAVTRPASEMLSQFFAVLPGALGGAFIIFVAYLVGQPISKVVSNFLSGVGLDNLANKLGLSQSMESEVNKYKPSEFVGVLALFAIMLFASIEAFSAVGLESVANLVGEFTVFLGHIGFGLIILAVGMFIAKKTKDIIISSPTSHAQLFGNISYIFIVALALGMALEQATLSDEILGLAFGLSFGAIALALGLAFGLGGREEAAKLLAELRQKLKS